MGTPTSTPTETAQPKKSNTMLYAAIIIIVVVIAGAASYFVFFSGGGTTCANTLTVTADYTSSAQTNYTWTFSSSGPFSGCVKVTWHDNTGSITHTVTTDSGPWPSSFTSGQTLAPGSDITVTLTTAGTYTFHCTPHPWMKGTITVT